MAWKIVLAIVAVLLVFYCAVVIWVPSYRFDDPTPFEGRFIYNPYNSASHVYEVKPQVQSLDKTYFFSLVPSIHGKQHNIFDGVKKNKILFSQIFGVIINHVIFRLSTAIL